MKPCPQCPDSRDAHWQIWLNNSNDVFALHFVRLLETRPVGFLSALGRTVSGFLGNALLWLSEALGVASWNTNADGARSSRSRLIWDEALARGIPVRQLQLFGTPTEWYEAYPRGTRFMYMSIPFPPEREAENLPIDDKISFKDLMRRYSLPVPGSRSATTLREAREALTAFGSVCVKPRSGSNGYHTYPHVRTVEDLEAAFKSAKELCYAVSVEEHLEGNLCRATCVDGALVGFLESYYPTVIGDGVSTITELVAKKNTIKPEGVSDIVLTPVHEDYIRRRGYTSGDILPAGISLPLLFRAGRSWGGGNQEHGRAIHSSFIPLIEAAAKATKLPLVGFDLIIPNPQAPAGSQVWGFIEANSLPWIDLHNAPLFGNPINVAPYMWDLWQKR